MPLAPIDIPIEFMVNLFSSLICIQCLPLDVKQKPTRQFDDGFNATGKHTFGFDFINSGHNRLEQVELRRYDKYC